MLRSSMNDNAHTFVLSSFCS